MKVTGYLEIVFVYLNVVLTACTVITTGCVFGSIPVLAVGVFFVLFGLWRAGQAFLVLWNEHRRGKLLWRSNIEKVTTDAA